MRRFLVSVLSLSLFLSCVGASAAEATRVRLNTNKGPIVIELDTEAAPKSAANFERYAREGYYDGTIFHRVIGNFMVQGGGFTPDMDRKETREPIENEAKNGLSNTRGTVAMARTNDPHSATSQFFINVVDNPMLDQDARGPGVWGYAVFGRVVEGMDVVDAIRDVPTTQKGPYRDVPKDPVIIESALVIE